MGASTLHTNSDGAAAGEPISESAGDRGGWVIRIQEWFGRHPRLAVVVVAALAVITSSYPVIFCGKSYVSPASVRPMIFDRIPWAPGLDPKAYLSHHESDTGAMMWWGVPVGFIESHSILDQGEIPLWNRYGHAGDILLGQAVSMLGDPLQSIVILGHGSAMAWDVKFLLAKLLFCAGFGWLVLRLLDNRGLAIIYTALAAYCGAFFYINNHPAFFVLAYTPWILLSAVQMLAARTGGAFRCSVVWLVANFSCFNAGHMEMAVVLLGGLNLAALIFALISGQGFPSRTRILIRMAGGTGLFLGLTAPMWISFVVALPQAYSIHSQIRIIQLSSKGILGLFDDCFYHWYWSDYSIRGSPGTSLLVLAGCILSVRRWRYLRTEPFFLINTGANIIWAACVFGLVPASIIALVPFLNRVGHLQVEFSYLLVIHLTLQSAFGFKSLLKPDEFRQAANDLMAVASVMGGMFMIYHLASGVAEYRLGYFIPFIIGDRYHLGYFIPCVMGAIGAPVLFKYLRSRNGRIGWLGWTGIIVLGFIPVFRFGLYNFGNEELMMLPGPRLALNAPIQTLNLLGNGGEPFRVAGMGMNFAGDCAAIYGLEDIHSCAPLSNGKYIELVQNFPGMTLPTGDWEIRVQHPGTAQPLLNLLNVKYLLANPHTPPPETGNFTVTNAPDFTVMKNNEAWPRAFFTTHIVPESSTADFVRQLLKHGDRPFVAVDRAQADRSPELRPLEQGSDGTVVAADHYQLLPNSTAFDIRTTAPGVVCLTEGQADDFLASANGKPVKVLTVNRAFKGVYLNQPGNYHLEFRFRPPYWTASISLFCISGGIVVFWGVVELTRRGLSASTRRIDQIRT